MDFMGKKKKRDIPLGTAQAVKLGRKKIATENHVLSLPSWNSNHKNTKPMRAEHHTEPGAAEAAAFAFSH